MHTIRGFWRQTQLLPRIALVLAVIAAAFNVGSYAGLAMRGATESIAATQIAVIGLGFTVIARTWYHHLLASRSRTIAPPRARVPRALIAGAVCAALYVGALVAWLAASYGEGAPEIRGGQEVWVVRDSVTRVLRAGSSATYAARELRLFSAVWLFFALSLAIGSHVVESRLRAYRVRRPEAAA